MIDPLDPWGLTTKTDIHSACNDEIIKLKKWQDDASCQLVTQEQQLDHANVQLTAQEERIDQLNALVQQRDEKINELEQQILGMQQSTDYERGHAHGVDDGLSYAVRTIEKLRAENSGVNNLG